MMNITRLVVPQMQERQNGLIINLGSFAAMRSLPFLSVYAGTKGFVKTYSQSLAYELEPQGIMVSHIFSFWVTSKMSGYRDPTLSVPSPEQYVECVFDRLGLRCGSSDSHTAIPYYPHSILNFVISCLWDPMHAKDAHYNIGRNLYRLGQLRQERRKSRQVYFEKAVDEELTRIKTAELRCTNTPVVLAA
ncbi:hypothetical protein LPJ66_002765 [Kickxella alabastrina]|uniref:Uncharacterized protein n=1 Tax=Kickxella alabastrina TaxID=61397 RepID=A0ACC1IPJ2_9FUNG|nr:hypothetical protein LPJ66_002765 [Kickxella alabastrina]